ncbi:MAG: hypothetical protein AB1630_04415 [bacterium]
MKCGGFEWSAINGVKFPRAVIYINSRIRNEWIPIIVHIDSGADITIINRSLGNAIVSNVESGRKVSIGGVGGGSIITYRHKISLKIGECPIDSEIAICEADPLKRCLLGFDLIQKFKGVYFDGDHKRTCFSVDNIGGRIV